MTEPQELVIIYVEDGEVQVTGYVTGSVEIDDPPVELDVSNGAEVVIEHRNGKWYPEAKERGSGFCRAYAPDSVPDDGFEFVPDESGAAAVADEEITWVSGDAVRVAP